MSQSQSQPSVHINNAKVEVAVCNEAYVHGAINILRKSSMPTAENQALVAMLEKCHASMNKVSTMLAAAENAAKAQQKTINFLRSIKTPKVNDEEDVSVISRLVR